MADRWRRANLTFVYSGISVLRITNLQRPIFRHGIMDTREPLVGRVSEAIHSQQV